MSYVAQQNLELEVVCAINAAEKEQCEWWDIRAGAIHCGARTAVPISAFFSERQITSQRFDRGLISSQFITLVNPSLHIDSNHSLDLGSGIFDTAIMEPGDDFLLLKRVDPGRNMNRFYRLSVEPTLFGGFAVRRAWGRVGTWGQTRLDLFADVSSALAHQQKLVAQKHRRGYRPE